MHTWLPRGAGVVVALAAVLVGVLGTSALYDRILEPCPSGICDPFERPTPPTRELLDTLGVSVEAYAVFWVGVSWLLAMLFIGLGLLLLRVRTSLLTLTTVVLLLSMMTTPFLDSLQGTFGDNLALGVRLTVDVATAYLFGVFPDGKWSVRWYRWAWPFVAAVAAASTLAGEDVLLSREWEGVSLLSFALMIGVQVHRYVRVSDWVARQQAKWVIVGMALLALNLLMAATIAAFGDLTPWQLPVVLIAYTSFAAIGLGFALALLRYRLYDVSLVLRRTAVYGLGLIGLVAAYFAFVALASLSLARSSASIVGAALVAALALGVGALVLRGGQLLRVRVLGAGSRPGGMASLLAQDMQASADVAATLARGLDLPYVCVEDADGRVLSSHGEPTTQIHRESVVDHEGRELGTLLLGESRPRRKRKNVSEVLPFVQLLLRAAGEAQALRDARAAAEVAREDERRRLRRDIHDGVGPLLASQLMTMDTLRVAAERGLPTTEFLGALEEQTRSALGEVRRISRQLRPEALDAHGLAQALRSEAERVTLAGLPTACVVDLGEQILPPPVETAVYRIVQEAMANAVKHAQASSASINVSVDGEHLQVVVLDDGQGLVDAVPGVGLGSMQARCHELGGGFEIGPRVDGAGTRVEARIPL